MAKDVINPKGAPPPSFPYSPGIRANGFVFVSGQVALDRQSGQVVGNDVAGQTRKVLENVREVLEAAGSSLDKLVKTTVFLADINQFQAMNDVYRELVPDPRPARSTVEALLARPDLLVEIEAVALAD
jgi:2-iminobutanoate/2-iminopropanoate deaminase